MIDIVNAVNEAITKQKDVPDTVIALVAIAEQLKRIADSLEEISLNEEGPFLHALRGSQ